ncbi:MAG: hypothetical protein A2Y60_00605 [Chloroflexi bacterium RBG_13_54_9]|nr:MAG: hypothetical protein A2Y60_00605 [Chloroflexi bacterium RBG_13_54_9]
MSITTETRKRAKIFYGWWVVIGASIISGIAAINFYGFSVFIPPLLKMFGWSRAQISLAASISRLEGGIEGPIVGWLIDKIGARVMAISGLIVAGLGFIWFSRVNSLLSYYLIYGVFLSIGFQVGFSHATYAVAAKWFIKKRSRAMSAIAVGVGVGGMIMPPILGWLIENYGWRNAAIFSGVALMAIGLPAAMVMRPTPEKYGLLPDGELHEEPKGQNGKATVIVKTAEVNLTVKEALKSANFWILIIGQVIGSVTGSVVHMHQTVHLTDMGIPYRAAATALGFMVGASIPGRIVGGWLGDIFDKRRLLLLFCIGECIGVYILSIANTLPLVYLFVIIYGFSFGVSIPLRTSLRGDLFGRTNFATIQGIMSPIMMPFGVIGPVFAGWVYDYFGSYQIAFYAWIFGAVIGAISYQFLRIPKPEVVELPNASLQP